MNRTVKMDMTGLNCPNCGGSNLHHGEVRVLTRQGGSEDRDGIEVRTDNGRVSMAPVAAEQMLGRRHSLEIAFWCELCPAHLWLQIMQHKGSTYLEWIAGENSRDEKANLVKPKSHESTF